MGTREHPLHGNVTPENNRMDKNAQSFSSCAGISPTSRVCIECRVGFYKLGDKCVASCPVQYYGHVEIVVSRESRTNRTVASCHKCHTACFKCKGPRSIDCFECSSGYILKGRQCIPKQLLDFMGHSEFLIWAVLLAFLLLIILYTLYRLRHRCLCLQEKQQQNNPTIREMPLHSSAPSAPPPAWPSSRLPQQPTTTTTDTTTGTTTATTLDTTTTTTPSSAAATTPTTQPTSPQQVIQPSSQQPNVQNQHPLHHHHNTHNPHHRHHHHHHHHRPHNHHHPHYHRQQQQHKSNLVAAEQVF